MGISCAEEEVLLFFALHTGISAFSSCGWHVLIVIIAKCHLSTEGQECLEQEETCMLLQANPLL